MFWRHEDHPAVLHARVERRPPERLPGSILLRELRCRKSILLTSDGCQSILLSAGSHRVQFLCQEGPSVLEDSAVLTFLIGRVDELHAQIDSLTRFAALCRQADEDGPPRGAAEPSQQALQWRNCLMALDGSLADASYRRIAETLYGEAVVAREWSSPTRSLKDWTRYAVRRGRELMNGKYRTFLKR